MALERTAGHCGCRRIGGSAAIAGQRRFSVRRAFPVRCLSAVIRLAVLGKVGPRLAGTDVGMLPREVVACLDLLPGDRLRRTFSARLYFLIFLFVV